MRLQIGWSRVDSLGELDCTPLYYRIDAERSDSGEAPSCTAATTTTTRLAMFVEESRVHSILPNKGVGAGWHGIRSLLCRGRKESLNQNPYDFIEDSSIMVLYKGVLLGRLCTGTYPLQQGYRTEKCAE